MYIHIYICIYIYIHLCIYNKYRLQTIASASMPVICWCGWTVLKWQASNLTPSKNLWLAPMGHQVSRGSNCLQIWVTNYLHMFVTSCVDTLAMGHQVSWVMKYLQIWVMKIYESRTMHRYESWNCMSHQLYESRRVCGYEIIWVTNYLQIWVTNYMYMYVTNYLQIWITCVYMCPSRTVCIHLWLAPMGHQAPRDMNYLQIWITYYIHMSVTNCVDTLVAGSHGAPGLLSRQVCSSAVCACCSVLQCMLQCVLQCVVVCVAEWVINCMQMRITKNTYMYVSICVKMCTSRTVLIHLWLAPIGHQVPQIMNFLQIRVIYYIYMCATNYVHTFVAGFYGTLN